MLDQRDWIGLALAADVGAVRWGALMREEAPAGERARCLARARAVAASGAVDALVAAAVR